MVVEDEAEGVANRIKEDTEPHSWLVSRFRRPDRENGSLGNVEISDIYVEMRLLWVGVSRPDRGNVVVDALESDGDGATVVEFDPL